MRILVMGASGFIGRHLIPVLHAQGHSIICGGRWPTTALAERRPETAKACDSLVHADFTKDRTAEAWLPGLRGVDAVINAVGIFREHGAQTFEALHVEGPCALFDACARVGVRRVIQISALGADDEATTAFHVSKRRADRHLATLPLAWNVVQPSLVYGAGGESAKLFSVLASLPWIPLPGRGDQQVQPIHIDDVTRGIAALLADESSARKVLPFVGPEPTALRDFLAELRGAMGLGGAHFLPVPLALVRGAARFGGSHSLLDKDALAMLARGNVGDARDITRLLGERPRPVREFVTASEASSLRNQAQLAWLLPLARISIALVWIVTGIVSFGLFPTESSYALLARTGVPPALAPFALYSAATLDLALGIGTLVLRRRRLLWLAQIALILVYTVIITVRLPEFWLHPYGPILKNLPMLAMLYLLYRLEERPWST